MLTRAIVAVMRPVPALDGKLDDFLVPNTGRTPGKPAQNRQAFLVRRLARTFVEQPAEDF